MIIFWLDSEVRLRVSLLDESWSGYMSSCGFLLFAVWILSRKYANCCPSLPPPLPKKNSAVFSLPEGKMLSFFGLVPIGHALDIPNGVLGMLYYLYTIMRFFIIRKTNQQRGGIFILFGSPISLVISSLAVASSIFLGRKLYILREFCIVCLSTHILNTTLWIRAMMELRQSSSEKQD